MLRVCIEIHLYLLINNNNVYFKIKAFCHKSYNFLQYDYIKIFKSILQFVRFY